MTDWDLISSYVGLVILATGSVYAGASGTVPTPPHEKSEDDDQEESHDRLAASDAWLFPIVSRDFQCRLHTK